MDFSSVLLPFVNEALRVFGLWAAAPALILAAGFEVRRKLIAKDAEIVILRRQIEDLQDKRLQDAREMIRVAEAGTAATTLRTQSDQRFADLIEALLHRNASPFGWRR